MHASVHHNKLSQYKVIEAYLDSVMDGKAKVSSATLLSHKLLANAIAPVGANHRRSGVSRSSVAAALHT